MRSKATTNAVTQKILAMRHRSLLIVVVVPTTSWKVMGFLMPTSHEVVCFRVQKETTCFGNFLKKRPLHHYATIPRSDTESSGVPVQKEDSARKLNGRRKPLQKAVWVYADYASRLWKETNMDARRRVAEDKAERAIRAVEHIVQGEEHVEFSTDLETEEARVELLEACRAMLKALENKTRFEASDGLIPEVPTSSESSDSVSSKARSVLFGAVMGAIVALWVFSGNYIFTLLFTLMTILGQLEYYRMVMNTGIYPARRISVVGACSMFITALFAPNFHQIVLPLCGLWAMVWFLTMRRQGSKISEIATTFTGMFYLGYVPSFWVRIRLIGAGREPTRLAPIAGPILAFLGRQAESLPKFIPQVIHLPITPGAIFIFWTWLALAFNDVGSYFVGRKFGKTKLGKIFPAAGAVSPNKTVEGFLGGCAVSAALSMLGAWVQKWPNWALTGAAHGVILGLVGLIGDLTASMLKRDAGLKDFGDLIPEHGGILDRVDGFIWTAPYSWLVMSWIVPAIKAAARTRAGLPI